MKTRRAVLFLLFVAPIPAVLLLLGDLVPSGGRILFSGGNTKLSFSQIRRLSKDKVLITDRHCLQVFSPYIEPDMPVFITTDSLLNAYHVLLEESVQRLELANARELAEVLKFTWDNVDSAGDGVRGDPELAAAAKRRAKIVLGTALKLLGGEMPEVDAATAKVIDEEAARVKRAAGMHKPAWLGPEGEPGLVTIDYSRFKPRGFYTASETLSGYFRAVSWLQAIPFRVGRDEELLAILLLGDCLTPERFGGDDKKRQQFMAFFERYREFLGSRDDWDLTTAAATVGKGLKLDLGAGRLEPIRRALLKNAAKEGEGPRINDAIAYPGQSGRTFRILSAYRTPDMTLFQKTTDPQKFSREFPTGLELCIALGSSYAERSLNDPEREKVLETIEGSEDLFTGTNLGAEYFDCLSTLLDDPPEGAPPFMVDDAWKAKSCQTVLAGWAQWRHTWVLQSRQTCVWSCLTEWEEPVGFVEPNPAFFSRLHALAERTARMFERVKFHSTRNVQAVAELQNLLHVLEAKSAPGETLGGNSVDELFAEETLWKVFQTRVEKMDRAQTKEFLAETIPKVKEALEKARRGRAISDWFSRSVTSCRWDSDTSLDEQWRNLADMAARLEELAEKQLSGTPFTEQDRSFILWYGAPLARLMFHEGDSAETPRDDVPRIADVVYNPNVGEYLEVGVARPRLMYVLYPTDRGEVLCRGAVLPYFEFRSPERLNDHEWKALLDSGDAPTPAFETAAFSPGDDLERPIWARHWPCTIALVAVVIAAIGWLIRERRANKGEQESSAAEG